MRRDAMKIIQSHARGDIHAYEMNMGDQHVVFAHAIFCLLS